MFGMLPHCRTQGMPTDCESNDNPYVVNIWEGLDEYTYNGTQEFNGSRLEMWSVSYCQKVW